jgi:adenosylmethionine-8-amino-7-oxononanoate aminotransferase
VNPAAWIARDRAVVWHPFTQFDEWVSEDAIAIDRAEGVTLIDTEGKKYLDGVSSLWCNVFGHRVPEIDEAVRAQLDKVAHSTFLGLTHEPGVRLAERLVSIAPPGLSRVFYSDSGSEAMEIALKIAYQYWRQRGKPSKRTFVTLDGAYHGDTVGSVSLGGIDLFHRAYKPLLFKTIRLPSTDAYRWPNRPTLEACGAAVVDKLQGTLERRSKEIAAVVLEPRVQGAAGMILQPDGFVARVRELTRKHGVLMIADEVATGFGRTGRMFALEHDGATPDLMAVAKGLTGGYLPLAATLATEEIFEAFRGGLDRTFFHGHTYTANPLACAAALATLDLFETRRTLQELPGRIEALRGALAPLRGGPHVGEVRQFGMMAGIELTQDPRSRRPFDPARRVGRQVCLRARRHGVLLRPLGDVIVVLPPLAMTETQIQFVVAAAHAAIQEVTEACGGK